MEAENRAVTQKKVCYHLCKIVIFQTFQVKYHINPQGEDNFSEWVEPNT